MVEEIEYLQNYINMRNVVCRVLLLMEGRFLFNKKNQKEPNEQKFYFKLNGIFIPSA